MSSTIKYYSLGNYYYNSVVRKRKQGLACKKDVLVKLIADLDLVPDLFPGYMPAAKIADTEGQLSEHARRLRLLEDLLGVTRIRDSLPTLPDISPREVK